MAVGERCTKPSARVLEDSPGDRLPTNETTHADPPDRVRALHGLPHFSRVQSSTPQEDRMASRHATGGSEPFAPLDAR